MKIIYKPIALIASLIAAWLGKTTFKAIWSKIDERDPPSPTAVEESTSKVVGAAVLKAATMAGVAALVQRGAAKSFHYLTGFWPGDHREDEEAKKDD